MIRLRADCLRIALLTVLTAATLLQGCSSSPHPNPTSSASPGPTSPGSTTSTSPESTPETLLGLQVKALKLDAPVPLPNNVAIYLESGCWGCDSPAAALQRVYRAADGAVRTEDLFRLPGATVPSPTVDGKFLMSLGGANSGNDFLLSVCEGPYCGGVGEVQPGAKTSIYHSSDGGITWNKEATIDGGADIVENFGGSPPTGSGFGLLLRHYSPRTPGQPGQVEMAYYPTLYTQPVELRGQAPGEARVFSPANGPSFLLDPNGMGLYSLQGALTNPPQFDLSVLPPGSRLLDFQYLPSTHQEVLITWEADTGQVYSGVADAGNQPKIRFTEVLRWPQNDHPFFGRPQGGFIDDHTWVVTVGDGRTEPAVVDLATATIRPISELVSRGEGGDRLLVKALAKGPFARVQGTGQGGCLNIRDTPSLAAASFGCYADGVLLLEMGQRKDADGQTWTLAYTPQQRQGWASTTFLETSGQAPSLAYYPAGTRTGNAQFDPIIAALEQSADMPQDLIGWQQIACKVPPIQGLGGPPACPPGVADGAPLDAISGAACEGYWRLRPDGDAAVRLAVGPTQRLYAVVRHDPSQTYPPGQYTLIYANPAQPEFGSAVYVSDGKVVGDWGGCGTSPAEILKSGAGVVFPPPPP